MVATQDPILTALRGFFLARSRHELMAACVGLARDTPFAPTVTGMAAEDWDALEFVFNKLFVGPMALQAPPYASFYLESEPQLMGASTLKVRRIYEMAGMTLPVQAGLPDDHLGVELGAARHLGTLAGKFQAQEPRALWRYFLEEHLAVWVPPFLERARNAESGHPAVDLALDALAAWLQNELAKEEDYNQ